MGKRGPQPGEGGRSPISIDIEVARRAARLGCTADEIAALVGVGRQTFYDHCKRDDALQEAIDEGRAQGRTTLRRLQWQRANSGSDTMLIWLGKQLLGQRDKHEIEQAGEQHFTFLHLVAAREVLRQINAERSIEGSVVAPETTNGGAASNPNASKQPPNLWEAADE